MYLAEATSVLLQTNYYKYARRRTGTGERIFRMAPLHHHFEALGMHETKIVTGFRIAAAAGVLVALLLLRV